MNLSAAQLKALRAIAKELRAAAKQGHSQEELTRWKFGAGPGTAFPIRTVRALHDRGFVVGSANPPVKGQGRSAFGKRPSYRPTVEAYDYWFTATPLLLAAIFPSKT